jgi:hypothetical protein
MLPNPARGKREQREDAALAAVVEAQHHGDVLERHDEHERPEHQRKHGEYARRVERQPVRPVEGFFERV